MQWMWTWGGECFGYFDHEDLWTHDGKHVGHRKGDEIYSPNGRYLGQIMSTDRLITQVAKNHKKVPAFEKLHDRVRYPYYPHDVGYAIYTGYENFPGPSHF